MIGHLDDVVVVLFVVAAQILPTSLGRFFFNWKCTTIIIATLFTTLVVSYSSINYLSAFKFDGFIITLIVSIALVIVLTFTYTKIIGKSIFRKHENIIGAVYWFFLLVIFSLSVLKSWDITKCFREIYFLADMFEYFVFTFIAFLVSGAISLYMFIYELRAINEKR